MSFPWVGASREERTLQDGKDKPEREFYKNKGAKGEVTMGCKPFLELVEIWVGKKICTGLRVGIQANSENLKGHNVMFGYESIKLAKALAGPQPRVQFPPVLVGKVKEADSAAHKMRSGESVTPQIWPTQNNASL